MRFLFINFHSSKPSSLVHLYWPDTVCLLGFASMVDFHFPSYLSLTTRQTKRGEVMCSRAHSSLVMELETESQGSEKPVEDEGPVCIGGGKVSLEIST